MNRPPRSHDPLLQPLRIRHLVLKNRIMSTSHASGLTEGGLPLERYQRYHEEKAIGGIGLSMFGGSSELGDVLLSEDVGEAGVHLVTLGGSVGRCVRARRKPAAAGAFVEKLDCSG